MSGEITVPVNCGQELYDVVEVTDVGAGLSTARRRVLGIAMRYSFSPSPRRCFLPGISCLLSRLNRDYLRLFTVRPAISFARFVDFPDFCALSLMCSYIRFSFLLAPLMCFLSGIRHLSRPIL